MDLLEILKRVSEVVRAESNAASRKQNAPVVEKKKQSDKQKKQPLRK